MFDVRWRGLEQSVIARDATDEWHHIVSVRVFIIIIVVVVVVVVIYLLIKTTHLT